MNEEKKIFIPVSKHLYHNDLLEQVYNPKQKTTNFLRWSSSEKKTIAMNSVEEGKKVYLPIIDELLFKGVVILPSGATEYGTTQKLEEEIYNFINTWLDISKDHLQKAVWYIMLSWIIDKLHTIPYLRSLGDYGTGKTRYLDVIGGICYKPMFVGGAVRSAPIYRVIDKWRGTAIFDEFTLGKSDETEDIIQILNNGYQRGKPVLRCDQGSFKVRAFDPFGAKILATRRSFYDKALESRCITEIMKMTPRKNIPIDLTEKFFKQREELQNKLLMYRFKNWEKINLDKTITVDFGNIMPRIKQSFSPFLVLFQHNKKRLDEFIQYTKEYNISVIEENSTSFDGQIFNAFIDIYDDHNQQQQFASDYSPHIITSSDIREHMINNGWKEDKLNASSIGRRLKSLGFKTKPQKIAGKTKKVLMIDDDLLKNLVSRYVVTAVTDVTENTEHIDNNNNTLNYNDNDERSKND